MDFEGLLKAKKLFRFTGPPEHWLTAVKYMTWGLTEEKKDQWEKIRPGDIFFIHSTGGSEFKNAKSGIIGLGVIGPDFSIKKNPLWFFESLHNINKWPLLIPLSEIYLFSELPAVGSWENPAPGNIPETTRLIELLLKNYIPLGKISGFPQMGSFSSVRPEVARQILLDKRPLYLYEGYENIGQEKTENVKSEGKDRQFAEIKNASEALRYVDTLKIFTSVKSRIIREPTSLYVRDNETLERATTTHQSILDQLLTLFQKHGYETRNAKTVDMFAHNGKNAFLLEVKSNESNNFRDQARKGIAQLFEYEYFEVQKFETDSNLIFDGKYKLIVPSQLPKDGRYVDFINNLKIGVAMVGEDNLRPVGEDLGFSHL